MAQHLQKHKSDDQLLVFGSLNPYRQWEPTFYGFPRYFNEKYNGINVAGIPQSLSVLKQTRLSPVLILFYYRDYFLTPDSRYSFHPSGTEPLRLNFDPLKTNAHLNFAAFTGFYVISLKQNNDSSAQNLMNLFQFLNRHIDNHSALIEMQLASAALKKALNQDGWEQDIALAAQVIPAGAEAKVQKIIAAIRQNPL